MKKLVNFEYGIMQGTYWMYFGVMCSFASVFLLEKNYSNSAIGFILALGSIVAVIVQPFIADFADRSKKVGLIEILEISALSMALLTGGLFVFTEKTFAISLIYVLLIAWITLLQPLINALSFKLTQKGIYINFGIARSVGSLAFSILVAILGIVISKKGTVIIPITGEIVLACFFICLVLTKKQTRKYQSQYMNKARKTKEITLLEFAKRNKMFIILTVGIVGLYFGNAVLNNFMMQIVSSVGGNSSDLGRVLAMMAVLEMPTLIVFTRIKKSFSCAFLIKVASIGFIAKILLCYLANSVTMIYIAQFAQLISFGLLLPSMVHFIDEIMSKGEAVKGQSVFIAMATLGAVFASLFGGRILDLMGAKMLLLAATVITVIGAVIIILIIGRVKKNETNIVEC